MTTTISTTATTTAVLAKPQAHFAGIAILLVILSGCGAESADVASITADTTSPRCRKPSDRNLLRNPGFDANVSGWSAEPGASIEWAAGFDALGCRHSGAAVVVAKDTSRVYQCVPTASSTKYYFGLRASRALYCDVNTFTGADCTGVDNGLQTQAMWLNFDWSPDLGGNYLLGDHSGLSFTTTPMDKSARVSCYSYGGSAYEDYPFNIDLLYLTTTVDGY